MHRRTTAVALDRFLAGESVPARWWLLGGFFTRWTEGCVEWKRWDRMHLGHPARPIAQQFRGPRRTDQFGCHFARRQLFRLARRQWGSQTLDRGEPPSGRFNALTVELAGPPPFSKRGVHTYHRSDCNRAGIERRYYGDHRDEFRERLHTSPQYQLPDCARSTMANTLSSALGTNESRSTYSGSLVPSALRSEQ